MKSYTLAFPYQVAMALVMVMVVVASLNLSKKRASIFLLFSLFFISSKLVSSLNVLPFFFNIIRIYLGYYMVFHLHLYFSFFFFGQSFVF